MRQQLGVAPSRTSDEVTKTYVDTTVSTAIATTLKVANNLSDLANPGTARANLGLGTVATMTAPSSALVGVNDSQTLQNKIIDGATNTIGNVPATGLTGTVPVGSIPSGIPQNSISGLVTSLSSLLGASTFQQLLDGIANALGQSGTGHTVTQVETYLGIIPAGNLNGTLGTGNIPGLPTSKITSGTFAQSMITNLATDLSNLLGASTFQSLLDGIANAMGHSGTGHTITDIETYFGIIPAANLTGTLSTGNIPGLPTSKITSGTFAQSMISNLATDLSNLLGQSTFQSLLDSIANAFGHSGTGHTITDIETYFGIIPATNLNGTVPLGSIPGLPTSQITSGTFAQSMVTGLATSLSNLLGTTTFQSLLDSIANAFGHSGTGHTITDIETYLGIIPATNLTGTVPVGSIPSNIPAGNLQGASGEQTLIDTFNNMYNQFASAFNQLSTITGVTLPEVAEAAQTVAQQASSANDMALAAANILAIRNNAPTYDGLDNTAQTNMPITALTTAPIKNTGFSNVGLVRIKRSASIGAITFLANTLGTPTVKPVYVNIFRVNFTTSTLEFIYASPDVMTSLVVGTSGGRGHVRVLLAGASNFAVEPGDVIAVELSGVWATTASGSVYLNYGANASVTNHPTALMANIGGSLSGRTSAPVQATADLPLSNLTFSSAAPYLALEISTLPPDYEPPYPTTYLGAQTITHTLRSWLEAGDFIDLTVLGGGGGGEGELGGATGYGGTGGSWGTQTLVVGTDVPVPTVGSPVTLSVVVGAGGALGPFFTAGGNGTASTVTWHDPSTAAHTLTGTFGFGGNHTAGLSHNTLGPGLAPSPQTKTFPTSVAPVNHYGGAAQFNNYPGNAPGGAGAGGSFGQYGTQGADGQVWLVERQA